MFGWYNDKWWQISDEGSPFDCTSEQLYEVLDGSFVIQQFPINEQKDKVVVGDWVRPFKQLSQDCVIYVCFIYSLTINFVKHT